MKSAILDSNIFIRHFTQDNKEQSPKATKIFASIEKGETSGLVSLLVVNEVIWILENYYEIPRNIFLPQLLQVLSLKGIKVIELKKEKLMKVLEHMQMQGTRINPQIVNQRGGGTQRFGIPGEGGG